MAEPFLYEFPGELDSDNSLAQAEDLGVVGLDEALNGEGIVCC